MFGRQAGPRAQVSGIGEPVHIPDLGDEHRGQRGPDAGQRLDRRIPAVATQFGGDRRR